MKTIQDLRAEQKPKRRGREESWHPEIIGAADAGNDVASGRAVTRSE
jgi:hypothetical protein